ncbi:MAG: hypothetical protein BGO99_04530 [Nitrosospira sp. 56-18]|jgi:transposase|nr:transposase [Nitrosospira sp.]OJY14652.1 MAG: hypothetical protein BGO99_04530 [Nitrosospira sp. 56-18]
MKKIPKQEYTAEFKELAIKRIKEGLIAGAASKELGVSDQTLRNRVKAAAAGKLNGVGAKVVTPEQVDERRHFHRRNRLSISAYILEPLILNR